MHMFASSRALLTVALIILPAFVSAEAVDDPWQPMNRVVFDFNETADEWVATPVAEAYVAVTPSLIRRGVSNVFDNFEDVNGVVNALLQAKVPETATNLVRVVLNSTLGLLGLFDVATGMGFERYDTDFGQTLAVWGVPQGPYVVLPILGPNTVRSSFGEGVDAYASVTTAIDDVETQWGVRTLGLIDTRASLLGANDLLSGDRYIFLRDAYLQRRQAQLSGETEPKDTFSDFDDDWESDDF